MEALNESSIFQLQRIIQNLQQADKTFANNSLTPPHMPVTPLGSYNAHKEKKSSLAEVIIWLSYLVIGAPVNFCVTCNCISLETPGPI